MGDLYLMNKLEVIYEDNHLIVVFKPCNILSQADKTGDICMLSMVKNYLKEKYSKPGNVYTGLVHRLDRPVSGLMVFAKTSKAASRLSEVIRNNEMTKGYLAVVRGYLPNKKGELVNYLTKDNDNNAVVTSNELGKKAVLEYELLKEIDDLSLVKINLITGRHHQIRIQFAHLGHPLYGDQRYGLKDNKQIALYSNYLSFPHPITKEVLEFEKKMPKGNIWANFV